LLPKTADNHGFRRGAEGEKPLVRPTCGTIAMQSFRSHPKEHSSQRTTHASGYNDGYADNLSLTLSTSP